MKTDIHGSQESLKRLKTQLTSFPEPNGSILRKYLEWHELKLERKTITHSSVVRSLGIALQVCGNIPNVSLMETAPLERYWSATTQRKATKKTQGKTINLKKNLSEGSLEKIKSQLIKFYKFVSFLNKYPDKELSIFKTSLVPKPDCCTFLSVESTKQREDFDLPTQQQVKLLIEELFKSKQYYSKMAGVLVAISNDCGLRFGEVATLKRSDIKLVDNFYLLGVSQSKTAKRTVICALAKRFLDEWFKQNKKGELVFEPFKGSNGEPIVYNSLRQYLILASKKVGVKLIPNHAFHTFRHCASSRMREMPQNEKRYFMGWKQDGLEAIYTRVSWEDCKKHYFDSLKGNPMLDFSLSEYEVEAKSQEEWQIEQIRKAVELALKEKKN